MARNDTDHPVHTLLEQRWSPYVFSDRFVSDDDLRSIFEAARWAASSYNEQPWRFIVARRDKDDSAFDDLLASLAEGNRGWAQRAPVLALGIVSRRFSRNDKPNKAAEHDLGLAAAQLTFEATARGLVVHQMIGILPDEARQRFDIPEGFDAHTALAIGYHGDADNAPDELVQRDAQIRQRRPLSETVFTGNWAQPAPFLES